MNKYVATLMMISSEDGRGGVAQTLFKQKRRYWESRSSLVELDAQGSSTDFNLNFDIHLFDSTPSEQDRSESNAIKHTGTRGCSESNSRTLSTSTSPSLYTVADDTESLSSSSPRIGGDSCQKVGRTLSNMITNCLVCCWTAVQGEKLHNDCFVATNCSSPDHSSKSVFLIPMAETSEKQTKKVKNKQPTGLTPIQTPNDSSQKKLMIDPRPRRHK